MAPDSSAPGDALALPVPSPSSPRLLIHEIAFGSYLLVMAAALLATGALREAWVYLGMLGLGGALTAASLRWDTASRWRWRLLFYPVAMNVAYLRMRDCVPLLRPARYDGTLYAADLLLFGATPSLSAESLVTPLLTEALSGCYIFFFPYLLLSLVRYLAGDLDLCRRFYEGLFTVYGLGFLGYLFVPAAGPCHAMADRFQVPLSGWAITSWNQTVVDAGSNQVDVFPSLHVAVSCFILMFDRRHARRWFRACIAPCAGLWIATIYLRYHYAVDVLAGFALAASALWLTLRPRGDSR